MEQSGDGTEPNATAGERAVVLSDEDREWVRQTAAGLAPLTDDERGWLAGVFQRVKRPGR
ncbi:hypothetical protein [Actinomadura sp. 6N118]|uniref:hypothetical protein n=1 Tax=Actinomadura sp. 6N118 TaxID=3375151 RepID=UPI0037A150E4